MLYLLVLVVVVLVVGLVARSRRHTPSASLATTAVRVGVLVSVVRLIAYGSGLALYTGHSDWRQSIGYALMILSSVAELSIAVALTGNRSGPSPVVGAFIVLTSAAFGWAWAWVRARRAFR